MASSGQIHSTDRPGGRVLGSGVSTLTLLLTLVVSLALTSCRKDPGPGGLGVSLSLPKGEVASVNSVDVSFDAPMVALGQTGSAPPLVRIKPPVPGRARWIGTRTWSFVPDRPFPGGTEFVCTVPAGTRSADRAKSVAKELRWSFTTPRPKVVAAWPENALGDAALDQVVVLRFNQRVDPALVLRAARLRGLASGGAPGGPDHPLRAERPGPEHKEIVDGWGEPSADELVLLRPARPLPRDAAFLLELLPTLTGMEGPLPMGEAWRLEFHTYGEFRLTGVEAQEGGRLRLKLTNRVDEDSLKAHLRFEPAAEVDYVSQWDPGDAYVSATLAAGTEYRLSVTPGLKDLFGNPLAPVTASMTFRTPDAGPEISLVPTEAVLERSRSREVALILQNVAGVDLTAARLTAEEFLRYRATWQAAYAGGRNDNPLPPLPGAVGSRHLERRSAWNRPDTLRVSLRELLGEEVGGVLVLHAVATGSAPPGWIAPDQNRRWPVRSSTTLRVTDLGVTAKTSPAGGAAWVTSLATGAPVADVELEIRNPAGAVVWRGRSRADGLASIGPLPREVSHGGSDFRLWARRGGDETYLALGSDWSLEPWNFGVSSESWDATSDREGFVYGDRELYRPGETVHLKAILRRRDASGLGVPAEENVAVTIRDPRGDEMLSATPQLSRFGTAVIDLPLPRAARPGYYAVRLAAVGGREYEGWTVYGSFRVEEYRAPQFKVELTPKRSHYRSGEKLDATLSAQYLFGAPLGGARASWIIRRNPATFAPADYPAYQFGDPELAPDYGTSGGVGDLELGADGTASLAPLLDLGPLPVSLDYEIEATVRDQTANSVAGTTRVTVHRGDVYPGIALDRSFADAGQAVPLKVVFLDPEGRPATPTRAHWKLIRREWRTARRLQVGGLVGSETTPVDSTILTRPLPTGSGPHELSVTIPSGGYYRVVVEAVDARRNSIRSAAVLYAAGAGDYSWGWEPGIKVELVADRKEYQPGDRARILVRSPFRSARALVTVEREGLISARTLELNGTAETVDVDLPRQGAAPNVIVSVALLTGSRAREGADMRLRVPEFRLGFITLPIDSRGERLLVRARPARTLLGPGDSLSVDLDLKDAAGRPVSGELSVAVVDEAVLRLVGTRTPDPSAHFYRPRGTALTTSELRRLVRLPLSEGGKKGDEPGGGGGFEAGYRSFFLTTACWEPRVVTDAAGHARVGFRLPDNLTTFRIMVVAVDGAARFGSTDTTVTVTKPLLIQPAIPRFAHRGDRFLVGAVVHNRSEAPLKAMVTAEFSGLERGDDWPALLTLEVPAQGTRRIDLPVRATTTGTANVRLVATAGAASDRIALPLPVQEAAAWVYSASAGEVSGEGAEEQVEVPAGVLPDSSRVRLALAPTLLGGLEPAFDYLSRYPYACVEQTASSAWSELLEAQLLGGEEPRVAATRVAERLAPYQNEDGGFRLWPGFGTSEVWTTGYALLVLADAARAGGDVSAIGAAAGSFLAYRVEDPSEDPATRFERAGARMLAFWALARSPDAWRNGRALDPMLDFYTGSRDKLDLLSRLYLALAWCERPGGAGRAQLILSEIDNLVEQTADQAWLPAGASTHWGAAWSNREQKSGLFLTASLSSGRQSALEPRLVRWLLEQRRNGHWGTTQANAMVLLGLAAWQAAREPGEPALEVTGALGGRGFAPVSLGSRRQPPEERLLPAGPPGSRERLTIQRRGTGALYYTGRLEVLEPTVGTLPRESGLTLERQRERLEGAGPLRAGDLVLTRLTLVVPEEADFLVLADPLPAGLEPVQLDFVTTGREAGRRLAGKVTPGRARLPIGGVETRDREVRLYVDHLAPGVYEYTHLARALTPGTFAGPRARVELMYHPEVSALSDGPPVEVRR